MMVVLELEIRNKDNEVKRQLRLTHSHVSSSCMAIMRVFKEACFPFLCCNKSTLHHLDHHPYIGNKCI